MLLGDASFVCILLVIDMSIVGWFLLIRHTPCEFGVFGVFTLFRVVFVIYFGLGCLVLGVGYL